MSLPTKTNLAVLPMHVRGKVYTIVGFTIMLMPSQWHIKFNVKTRNKKYAIRVLRKKMNIPKHVKL